MWFPPPSPCKYCGCVHDTTFRCRQEREYKENYLTPYQERRLKVATEILQGILSRELPMTAAEGIQNSLFYADRLIKAVKNNEYKD